MKVLELNKIIDMRHELIFFNFTEFVFKEFIY